MYIRSFGTIWYVEHLRDAGLNTQVVDICTVNYLKKDILDSNCGSNKTLSNQLGNSKIGSNL